MMKTKSTTCLRCSRRAGLTLIEVVAAIAILGTILVGVVLAKARHTHQIALTQRQSVAVRAADELIAGWWASPEGVPINESGVVETDQSLTWETRLVENSAIEQLGAHVVRVEVRQSESGASLQDAANDPLVVVELVLPLPDREMEQKGGDHE